MGKNIMKSFIWLISILILVNFSYAANVCIVIEFPDKIESECLDVNEGINGYELLEQSSFDITWSQEGMFGHSLCKIDNIGDEVSGPSSCAWGSEYWSFYFMEEGEFVYSPVGLDASGDCWNGDFSSWLGHYCTKDNDLLAFSYGDELIKQFSYGDELIKQHTDLANIAANVVAQPSDVEFKNNNIASRTYNLITLILVLLSLLVVLIFASGWFSIIKK